MRGHAEQFEIGKKVRKKFSMLRVLRNILGVLFIVSVVAVSVVFFQYNKMRSHNEKINQMVIVGISDFENNRFDTEMISDGAEDLSLPIIDFDALREINEDSVGWIYACQGKINYPVVASTDEYYLEHAIDGIKSKAGTIFVSSNSANPFLENRAVIYGHNMKDGSMFHPLLQYWQDSNYLSQNPYIYIITENKIYTYKITSVYVDEYEDLEFTTNTHPDGTKRLNLITCEYSGKNSRLVIEAKQIENK